MRIKQVVTHTHTQVANITVKLSQSYMKTRPIHVLGAAQYSNSTDFQIIRFTQYDEVLTDYHVVLEKLL